MKRIRVKLKEKAIPDVIAMYGEKKAFCKIARGFDDWYDIAVSRYNGKDYFLVWHNGKLHECMPL